MLSCSYGLQHHLHVLEGNQSVGGVNLEERDVALNIGQPLVPLPNAVNETEGIILSCPL